MVMSDSYSSLISIESLFQAWQELRKGKSKKYDVQVFERHLEGNLFNLHDALMTKTYKHGTYSEFYVNDPKRRHIHKASLADRVVHHLLYKCLYQVFDKTFIFDSYSCRLGKGTHKAVKRLEKFTRIVSKNYIQNCWVLKLDIKKFFESVDHEILKNLITKRVRNQEVFWLINQVIDSFPRGIPLGNLTSQVFANIYLNELDQFAKHKLKAKYYLRYADDFLILNEDISPFYQCINKLRRFLSFNMKLELHPKKIILRKLIQGIDFCGYVVLPHYRLPRIKTKRRIFEKILTTEVSSQSLQSYLGYLSHANTYQISRNLINVAFQNQDY